MFSNSSIFAARLSGDVIGQECVTSSGVGSVPVRSRLTRRRNSASVQISDGTIPTFRSLFSTSSSILRAAW